MTMAPVNDDERPLSLPAFATMRAINQMAPAELALVIAAATGALHDKMGRVHANKVVSRVMDELRGTRPMTLREVAFKVAQKHGIKSSDLTAPNGTEDSKSNAFAHPRQEAYWLAYKQPGEIDEHQHSLTAIGRFFGGRDHTTVLFGIRAYERRGLA
jgi:chromosomal replication initiation ATPase DnaA